jgi:hypothetical protein
MTDSVFFAGSVPPYQKLADDSEYVAFNKGAIRFLKSDLAKETALDFIKYVPELLHAERIYIKRKREELK